MKNNMSMINLELQKELRVAIGYSSLSQFAERLKMFEHSELVEMYYGKLKTLPNRELLRRIANNSEGRVTVQRLYDICQYSERDSEEDNTWIEKVKPIRGSIYMVDFGIGEHGVQGSIRPALVVSNHLCNNRSASVTVIPITTKIKRNLPTHILLTEQDGMYEESSVICEQVTTVSKRRFLYNGYVKYIGSVSEEKLEMIENALMKQLGLKEIYFNESFAYTLIEKVLELKTARKFRNTKTLVDILNDEMNKLEKYCIDYGKDKKEIYENYKRNAIQESFSLA